MSEQQNSRQQAMPRPTRPQLPASYGIQDTAPAHTSGWPEVTARIAAARNYWIATTRPDGRPHVRPVWGVWLDDSFYFATDRASRKARNLAANSALVVHLESGDDVTILEGTAEEVTDASLLTRFADVYEAKYQFRPDSINPAQVVYRVAPRLAHSWLERDFVNTATRWVFAAR